MSNIIFKNSDSRPVLVSLWWGSLKESKTIKVAAGQSTNFGKNTTSFGKAWDGWTVEVKDSQKYVLANCYSLCHNARVTLMRHSQHGYQSSYAIKVS